MYIGMTWGNDDLNDTTTKKLEYFHDTESYRNGKRIHVAIETVPQTTETTRGIMLNDLANCSWRSVRRGKGHGRTQRKDFSTGTRGEWQSRRQMPSDKLNLLPVRKERKTYWQNRHFLSHTTPCVRLRGYCKHHSKLWCVHQFSFCMSSVSRCKQFTWMLVKQSECLLYLLLFHLPLPTRSRPVRSVLILIH